MDDDLLAFFLQDKPARILLVMAESGKTYPADVSKALAATYSHIVRVIQKLEIYGLIKSTKEGRTKYIELTDAGQEVASALKSLNEALTRVQERLADSKRPAEKLE